MSNAAEETRDKTTPPRRVPKFQPDVDPPAMNRPQKPFYQRTFLPSLLAGDPVDLQGQWGYLHVLFYELLDERRSDPIEARHKLKLLIDAYEDAGAPYFAKAALADFYFLEGDFASGYSTLGTQPHPSHHLSLAPHVGHPQLTAWQVLRWAPGGFTQKGLRELGSAMLEELQRLLDEFHAQRGLGIVEDFWLRLTADGTIQDVSASIEDDVVQTYTNQDVQVLLERGRQYGTTVDPPLAFERHPGYEEEVEWPGPWVNWGAYAGLMEARLRAVLRDAENTARDKAGVHRVGERWPSERALFERLRDAFPDEKILHQFRPWWLRPQSLDIYLPDHNIAIEYQGAQHTRPVEFFGGEEAFEDGQMRDLYKRQLCEENGCTLIEVHPGYLLDEVVAQVRASIADAIAARASVDDRP